MEVLLDAIKFNHDANSATTDALNIRRNETQFITVPEWQRGINVNPEDSPAAYTLCETRGHKLTIQAKFSVTDSTIQTLEIRAIDTHVRPNLSSSFSLSAIIMCLLHPALLKLTGSVLGEVKEKYVFPSSGKTDFETFELKNVQIWDVGVGVHDIAWRWQYRLNAADDWKDFAITKHRIYIVLKVPQPPWQQIPFNISNTQLPWTEVLDYACRWAAAAKDADNAAGLVTRHVNDLGFGLFEFDKCGGSAHYTTTPWQPARGKFDCAAFLNRLRGGQGNGKYVNCTDCATIVSSFANSVGCDLSQMLIGFFYKLKPHQRIGNTNLLRGGEFFHHDVAWEGEGKEIDELYDASLQLEVPETNTLLLATNLRFGLLGEEFYRFRLVLRECEYKCLPRPELKTRRTIGNASRGSFVSGEPLLELAKQHYDYESWVDVKSPGENLFVLNFFLREKEFPSWRLYRIQKLKAQGRAPVVQSYWTSDEDAYGLIIRLDVYECLSRTDARLTMLGVLAGFQLPDIAHQVAPAFGDVAFAGTGDCPILFARANYVFLLRNIGEKTASLGDIAQFIDARFTGEPKAKEEMPSNVRRFRPAVLDAKVGESVLLEEDALIPSGQLWMYKFFSPTGDVYIEGGRLAYKPDSPGLQLIKIYAIDEHDNVVSYALQFYAI
jgi:hypothetical protein